MDDQALEQTEGGQGRLPCTIVTGATSGIGLELACQLAAAGVRVIAIGRNSEALLALAALGRGVVTYAADLGEINRLPALAARIVQEHPETGCLIVNVGVNLIHWAAAKNFDWSNSDPKAPTVFLGAAGVE